jgi:putative addiction module component (TIGR02574 family)
LVKECNNCHHFNNCLSSFFLTNQPFATVPKSARCFSIVPKFALPALFLFYKKYDMMRSGGSDMETSRNILDQALKLEPADRFLIIEGLLNSLDEPDKTIEEIWAIEAEKRLKAYKEGKLKTVSYEDVFGHKTAGR